MYNTKSFIDFSPELCWRSVQHIIIRTSKKHSFADPNPAYKWQVNGAGLSSK